MIVKHGRISVPATNGVVHGNSEGIKGIKGIKGVRNRLFEFGPSLRPSGDFQAQLPGCRGGPRFVAERGAAFDAAADGVEFGFGLR